MQIVTCVKQVPDTTLVQIDPKTNTLIRKGVPFIMNPFDAHALEESLRLKDSHHLKVSVISMGPPNTVMTLRKALSLGADQAILLSDRAFGGADTLATSKVLSEAIKRLSAEDEVGLVLCGKQTIDGDTAQVGPGIATRLGIAQLTLVDRILELDLRSRTVTVRRKLEGRHEIVRAKLPAMITVVREINRPRYATLPMRLMSETAEVPHWDNAFMKLDESKVGLRGSPTQVRKIFSPERSKGEIIGDGLADPEGTAQMLIDRLVAKDIITSRKHGT